MEKNFHCKLKKGMQQKSTNLMTKFEKFNFYGWEKSYFKFHLHKNFSRRLITKID